MAKILIKHDTRIETETVIHQNESKLRKGKIKEMRNTEGTPRMNGKGDTSTQNPKWSRPEALGKICSGK